MGTSPAALYALLSTPFVSGLRHWWCVLPAVLWTLILVAEQYAAVRRISDPWSTLTQQIEYLYEEDPGESRPVAAP
jgi:cellulose synthase/poly-beta-1,6-N-acetylglucosamine synthase-like glycosyltransferase